MLGYISGKLISKNSDSSSVVILVNGLGYEVIVARRLFDSLSVEEERALWLQTVVREDAFTLYAFGSELEKQFFKLLLSVTGLGPKSALALISEHGAERLAGLIIEKNANEIARAPGIGKKSAQRMVLEIGNKVEKWSWTKKLTEKEKILEQATELSGKEQLMEDLNSALSHLGYLPTQIKHTLERIGKKGVLEEADFENCLKVALKDITARSLATARELS